MEVFNLIFGIIIGLISLTFLVALHELGHALAAKKNGVKLKEYAIGFPPRIKSFKAKTDKILPKGTKISIGAIPLGGFVRLQGEHDSDSKKGDYGAASFWGKTQILFAGVAMNWLVAFVIFTVLAISGMPKLLPNQFYLSSDAKISGGGVQVSAISKNSPAEKAGLNKNDTLLEFNGQKVENSTKIRQDLKNNAGKTVSLKISRNGKEISKSVKLNEKGNNGFLGAVLSDGMQKIHSTWSAPIVGLGTTVQFTGETFKGVGELFVNFFGGIFEKVIPNSDSQKNANTQLSKAGESVSGPVMVIGGIFPNIVSMGMDMILMLTAIISISLACMNVLPIPALDGGRWFMTFIFRVLLKKPLPKETEENINGWSFLALMGLSVLIIVLDFTKIFRG
ncbi:MAG: M50 family metallopeptidase [Candidatus Nanogingivalaceae bacterium]|nr:MAG: M50 family metallopeptidase [Candidatus Nanogingivalaceae bacterium]QWB91765.1 MAG: M50 family metallopeptidase [Candidatus Nanogingivalaceae bacterium]